MKCIGCGYIRQEGDIAPEWQCPSCKMAYNKTSKVEDVDIHQKYRNRPSKNTQKLNYVKSNLLKGEHICHSATIHPAIYVPGAALILFGLILSIPETTILILLSTTMILLGFYRLAMAHMDRISTEFVITNKRTILKSGYIARKIIELKHNKVESLNIDQSVLGRYLDYGSLEICGTGSGKTPVHYIKNPIVFRKNAMEVIGNYNNEI